MARFKLSKSALQQERNQLKLYERMLPSLDLKRRQLTMQLAQARREHAAARAAADELDRRIGQQLPMLAKRDIDVSGFVNIRDVEIGEENVVGVRLPVLKRIDCSVADYSRLVQPAWVDVLAQRLADAAEQRARVSIAAQRVRMLEEQEKRVTQRVNLFDKILIPQAKHNCQRIRIFLGDAERASVARSKLAKGRQARQRAALLQQEKEL